MKNFKWFSLYGILAIIWSIIGLPFIFTLFFLFVSFPNNISDTYLNIILVVSIIIFYYGIIYLLLRLHKTTIVRESLWYRYITVILTVIITTFSVYTVIGLIDDVGPRFPSNDSQIRWAIGNIRNQVELYYDQNNFSYEGACESDPIIKLKEVVESNDATNYHCETDEKGYKIWALLPIAQEYICEDHTGFSGICNPTDFNNI